MIISMIVNRKSTAGTVDFLLEKYLGYPDVYMA
jgi:hypothetical protein